MHLLIHFDGYGILIIVILKFLSASYKNIHETVSIDYFISWLLVTFSCCFAVPFIFYFMLDMVDDMLWRFIYLQIILDFYLPGS